MIQQLFKQLRFSDKEMQVYLCLAELGKTTASLTAKKLQIPRSTAYSVLEALVQRGVVSLEQTSGATYYVVNQPEALQRMVAREKEQCLQELSDKEEAATELLKQVTPFFKSTNYSVPRLQFFEGTANVESMLYDLCRDWQKSISRYDYVWWGYQDHQFVETYREWLDYYWATMHEKERIMLLSNKSETEKDLKGQIARRQIKMPPKGLDFSSTIWVLGDYVVTIMTRQKPHYAFQLKDAVFAANQRNMFQMLWGFIN